MPGPSCRRTQLKTCVKNDASALLTKISALGTQSGYERFRIAAVQSDINRPGGNATGVTIPTTHPRQSSSHEGQFEGHTAISCQ